MDKYELCIAGAWIFTGTLDECKKEYIKTLGDSHGEDLKKQLRKTMTIWKVNSKK